MAPRLLTWLACLACAAALAQDNPMQWELRGLLDEVSRPDVVVTAEQGQRALERLAEMNLDLRSLAPTERALAVRIEIFGALASGDAARAARAWQRLETAEVGALPALDLAYLVAVANGDAFLARQTLVKLHELVPADRKTEISRRRMQTRLVGTLAPEVSLAPDGQAAELLRERGGRVLLVDFWNPRRTAADPDNYGLRALFEAYGKDARFRMIGVCGEMGSDPDELRKRASDAKYIWPQQYGWNGEALQKAARGLGVVAYPVSLLIDQYGYIRAMGNAHDPAFQYAVRAAVAEARGEFPPIAAHDVNGTVAKLPGAAAKPSPEPAAAAPSRGPLPSDPEAEALLRQARLYIKTGKRAEAKKLLEEIIAKHPNTRQAEDARERLEGL